MPRTIAEATTRLPDPVRLDADLIRYYQLRPIPGQLAWGPEPHQILMATVRSTDR